MHITFQELELVFKKLIAREMSREQADLWASSVYRRADEEKLVFSPIEKKEKIENALAYLHGIDLKISKNTYLHTDIEVSQFADKFFS
jgi:hypothetical protein